jgi:magnesium-transporting ATPase (P-type)
MITGDIKETAQSIARQLNILEGEDQFKKRSFTGAE